MSANLKVIDGAGEGNDAEPTHGPDGFHLNEGGNAQRLVQRHGPDLRYAYSWHKWLTWDGQRWALDDTGEPVRRMLETLRHLVEIGNELGDKEERKKVFSHAIRSETDARVRGALSLAQAHEGVPVLHADLDADPLLLNVANGTIDLRTGELRPHSREDLITKLADVAYDPDAEAPRFDAFLERVFSGDADTIAFIQRYAGYSLTGSTVEQKIAILWGGGSNGKTTLLDTLRSLLGDYGQQAPAETFLERRGDSIPNDLARMRGARMILAAEVGEGRRLNEPLVKTMTGGERIVARHMRSEWFEFVPAFTPWLATNHKPEIRGVDLAIWRRVRLVPFTVTIPEEERDNHLAARLRDELPGILNWALAGCLAWQRDGLGSSDAIDKATEGYREESDVLGGFLEDCCVIGDTVHAKASDLYTRYGYWASANGVDALKQQAFGRRLSDRGFQQKRTNALGRHWVGVGIRHDVGHVA